MATNPKTRWLTRREQQAWRAYIRGTLALTNQLDKDLRKYHGLSLAEYEIMVQLSEAPQRQLRMTQLATSLNYSRSRLSHMISRMEAAGLVARCGTTDDGRGIVARLTDEGFSLLEISAHTHVQGVRRYLVDPATQEDFAAVGRVFDNVTGMTQTDPL